MQHFLTKIEMKPKRNRSSICCRFGMNDDDQSFVRSFVRSTNLSSNLKTLSVNLSLPPSLLTLLTLPWLFTFCWLFAFLCCLLKVFSSCVCVYACASVCAFVCMWVLMRKFCLALNSKKSTKCQSKGQVCICMRSPKEGETAVRRGTGQGRQVAW